jgi:hypothetical protein
VEFSAQRVLCLNEICDNKNTTMNISFTPLLADTMAAAEHLNNLAFAIACGLALVAMICAFLPRKWKAVRWVNICFALLGSYLVIELARNNSPQWQPAPVLIMPVAFSWIAVWLSWKPVRGVKK